MLAGSVNEASNISIYQLTQKADVKTAISNLVTACEPVLPDDNENARTVGNWLVLLRSVATSMSAFGTAAPLYETAGDYLARMYRAASDAQNAGRITAAQAAALLAAWNTHIGTP